MAAHVKTALEQIKNGEFHYDHLLPAFDISCWTDDLEFSDYCDFSGIVKSYVGENEDTRRYIVKNVSELLLPKYTAKWENLGKPQTREQWHKAQYGR